MTNELRFVLDTNLVISAMLLKQSVSRRAFDKARQEGHILLSWAVLKEFKREKFNKYLTERERLSFLNAIVRSASLIEISEFVSACRDPKDDKFLELAVNGQAQCLFLETRIYWFSTPFKVFLF
jgi:uncharacterized protein